MSSINIRKTDPKKSSKNTFYHREDGHYGRGKRLEEAVSRVLCAVLMPRYGHFSRTDVAARLQRP